MARLPDLRACETGRGPKLVGAHGVHRRPPQGSWHFLFARAAVYIFRACLETKCKRRAAPASCLTLVLVMVEVGPSDRDGARGQQRSGRARANQVQQGARNAMKLSACVAQAVGTLEWWPRAPGVLTFVSTRTVVQHISFSHAPFPGRATTRQHVPDRPLMRDSLRTSREPVAGGRLPIGIPKAKEAACGRLLGAYTGNHLFV